MVLREVPEPSLGKDDILLRVRACGLCGTDLKIYDGHVNTVKLPRIMGHELAGEVAEVGEGVDGWEKGDHGVVHICQAKTICKPRTYYIDPIDQWRRINRCAPYLFSQTLNQND
jgi:D-arabinose 1-dehydrogenase-like Zn-dependent alcohol dehydrogenase